MPNSYYKHGDWNVICDRCGFKFKRSECRYEWNGLLVCKDDWEPRHPQDFVRGVADRQAVPDARPDTDGIALYAETTLSADEVSGETELSVTSNTGFSSGDSITIFLDNDETHLSTISSVGSGTVTISTALPSKASSGKKVIVDTAETTL